MMLIVIIIYDTGIHGYTTIRLVFSHSKAQRPCALHTRTEIAVASLAMPYVADIMVPSIPLCTFDSISTLNW